MKEDPRPGQRRSGATSGGLGQLTLVEHALCPLDSRVSLRDGLKHETRFRYTDAGGERRAAPVRIDCADGLSATDEFYLWGLLGLTFSQPDPSCEFHATPGYCLRHLGVPKGGKSYRLFYEALTRLAGVRYRCESFYDPARGEHRRVAFGLLGFNLPLDIESSRQWRVVWDAQFFGLVRRAGGGRWFDLATYRRLDPASRRLWLLLAKRFYRKRGGQRFALRSLTVDGLGFASSMTDAALRAKLKRCAGSLAAVELLKTVNGQPVRFSKPKGTPFAHLTAGPAMHAPIDQRSVESPLWEPLQAIGFSEAEVGRLLKRHSKSELRRWSDVTLAAIEHKGRAFFKKNPLAYTLDNLKRSREGRTPPDWYVEVRKAERRDPVVKPREPASFSRAIDPADAEATVRRLLAPNPRSCS